MGQMMHIFKKDVRSLWLQIALTELLLGGYVWGEVKYGPPPAYGFNVLWSLMLRYGLLLVIVGWWALVVRCILEEPLVGDRQFWVTRPYEWRSLLGAKLLFILIFIHLPLLIAQMLLLASARLSIVANISDLLQMQLYDFLIFILPAVVFASISRSVGRTLLTAFGAIAFIGLIAYLDSDSPSGSASIDAFQDWPTLGLLLAAAVVIVYWQYAQRAITKSRYCIAAISVFVAAWLLLTPYNMLLARDFPLFDKSIAAPAKIHLNTSRPPAPKLSREGSEFNFIFPILAEAVPGGVYVKVDHVRIRLEAGDQYRWDSGWRSRFAEFYPGENKFQGEFTLNRKQFDRLSQGTVSARISITLTQYSTTNPEELTVHDDFDIPGIGRCRANYGRFDEISCIAERDYPALLATVPAGASSCAKKNETASYAWLSGAEVEPGIDPVHRFNFWFRSYNAANDNNNNTNPICPGTKVLLSHIYPTRSFRMELPEVRIRLEDYREVPFNISGFSIGVD